MNPNWALRLLSVNIPMERMVAERGREQKAWYRDRRNQNILHFQMRITIILGHLQNTLCYENKTNCYCISDTDGRAEDDDGCVGWLAWIFLEQIIRICQKSSHSL